MERAASSLKAGLFLTLAMLATGCIVAGPREGYYDREHQRYYHEHAWHECHEHDEFCR